MRKLASLWSEAVRLHQAGQLAEATELYRRILARDKRQLQVHANLGAVLRAQGKAAEALASYERAIALKLGDGALYYAYARTLHEQGRVADAIIAYAKAIALKPQFAEAWYSLGRAHADQNQFEAAAEAYRKAIAIKPDFAMAINNLGVVLADQNQFEAAAEAYRKAIAIQPGFVYAIHNLGRALLEQGDVPAAIATFDQALALDPRATKSQANRIFAELYRPGVGLADMLRLPKQWSIGHARAAAVPVLRQSERPRLGFVSADFRQHAVGLLAVTALEGLGALGYELVCYSNSPQSDGLTTRFRETTLLWRETSTMSDEGLDAQIRADGIDILFDLSGYSRGNRLSVFARRPAPLQVSWLGYLGTSGLDEIDYLLTDRWQAPAGTEAFYSETLLRLPHSYVVFEPPPDLPEPGPPPALKNNVVTFASFNALKKVNPDVMQLWVRILARLPGARLLLKSMALDCAATRASVIARFADAGVPEQRLELIGNTPKWDHLVAMARADIALDTFPFSGGITTLDNLWMGLPVITLPGETLPSRQSLSYLRTLGLNELVAESADDYVERAVALALDPEKLATLRAGMRARILASPLADRNGFAADLSAALSAIWQRRHQDLPAIG